MLHRPVLPYAIISSIPYLSKLTIRDPLRQISNQLQYLQMTRPVHEAITKKLKSELNVGFKYVRRRIYCKLNYTCYLSYIILSPDSFAHSTLITVILSLYVAALLKE